MERFKVVCLKCGKEINLKDYYEQENISIIVDYDHDIEFKCSCGNEETL